MLRAIEKDSAWFGVILLAWALAGCGAQAIRDDAQKQIKTGQFEKALKTYEDGLARYPDSVALRAGLVTGREAIFASLMAEAAAARTGGNDESAEAVLRRALAINPGDDRARGMLLDIERDRRQKAALARARQLAAKGLHEQALLVIESALKDNPAHAELIALQRKLELGARDSAQAASRLAETRPITLEFRDASVRMVLEAFTRNSGIRFILDKDVRSDLRITVFVRDTPAENALELLATGSQLAYKVLDSATVVIYPRTAEKIKEYQDLVIRAFYLSSADVKQTAAMLKTMLKIREPFIDEKLNLIMVRETPEVIRMAERLIALQDLSEPEVMMEVEVLEIKSSRLTELGIKYPDTFTLTPLAPEGAASFTLGNLDSLTRDSVRIGLPSLIVNLRRDTDNVHILANPKIRARNREKAKVMIGDKLPVITTTGSATNGGFISESVQYVDVGLKLDVEPNIYLDDQVAIKVGLEVSSLVREIKTSGGSLVYQIGTRTANTVLRLRDGETQLLAGLMSNEERESANKVPGLGELPLIGRLFSSRRNDGQRTEIVLSITPRIVHNIRRPDLNQSEFWSGTESEIRSSSLAGPAPRKPAGALAAPSRPTGNKDTPAPPLVPGTAAPDATDVTSSAPVLNLVAPAQVKVGEVFSVQVNLKAASGLRGLPAVLAFTPATLEVLDAQEGGFFTQNGAAVSQTKTLEQAQGRASMTVLRAHAAGATGEGTAMTFRFKAIAAGAAEVRLSSANIVGSAAAPAAPLPPPASITVK